MAVPMLDLALAVSPHVMDNAVLGNALTRPWLKRIKGELNRHIFITSRPRHHTHIHAYGFLRIALHYHV
jgi:hypothetical protein